MWQSQKPDIPSAAMALLNGFNKGNTGSGHSEEQLQMRKQLLHLSGLIEA